MKAPEGAFSLPGLPEGIAPQRDPASRYIRSAIVSWLSSPVVHRPAKRRLDSICTTDTALRQLVADPGTARKLHRTLMMQGFGLSRTESHDPRKPYCDDPVLVGLRALS